MGTKSIHTNHHNFWTMKAKTCCQRNLTCCTDELTISSNVCTKKPQWQFKTTNSITEASPQAWMNKTPDIEEVRKAVGVPCDEKSQGVKEIHSEIIESGGERVLQALANIIKRAYMKNWIPQDWKGAQQVRYSRKAIDVSAVTIEAYGFFPFQGKCLHEFY